MALMEISVLPLGSGQPGVGDFIADLVRYLRQENIPHHLTDMGTNVEGEVERLLDLARTLHELPFSRGIQRVVTHITLDDRRDKEVHLGEKTSSVEERLK